MSINIRYANVSYAAEDMQGIETSVASALTKTVGMPTIDKPSAKRLAKIGLKSESFAREAHAEALQHTDLMPRGLDITRMGINIANRDALRVRLAQIEELASRVRTALILHGVDAYHDGLAVYNALQYNGDYRQADAIARLGRIFRNGGAEEPATETTPPPSGSTSTPSNP